MRATVVLTVDLDRAWLEREADRPSRHQPVESLAHLIECRAFDSIRHVDGVERVAVASRLDDTESARGE